MASCCVILRGCGGSGVSTLGSYAGGGSGAWVTAVLKMAAIFLRAVVCFSPRCGMGMDGVGFCWASVSSAAALGTTFAGERLGKFFWTGKSSVVSDTCSDAVLFIGCQASAV